MCTQEANTHARAFSRGRLLEPGTHLHFPKDTSKADWTVYHLISCWGWFPIGVNIGNWRRILCIPGRINRKEQDKTSFSGLLMPES